MIEIPEEFIALSENYSQAQFLKIPMDKKQKKIFKIIGEITGLYFLINDEQEPSMGLLDVFFKNKYKELERIIDNG